MKGENTRPPGSEHASQTTHIGKFQNLPHHSQVPTDGTERDSGGRGEIAQGPEDPGERP